MWESGAGLAFPQLGSPPQVYWQALGCTYWVHWHMLEIIGPLGQEECEGQEKVSTLTCKGRRAAGEQSVSWACSFFPSPSCRCTLALWILLVLGPSALLWLLQALWEQVGGAVLS